MSNDVTLKAVLIGEDRSLSKTMKGAGDSVEQVGKKSKTAGAMMKGALSAEVVMRVADAVVDFGKDSIEAYRGAEISQKQLEDAYKRFPKIASVNIDKLRDYNQALQDKGYADADDIASGQASLARYKLTGDQLKRITPLLVDYANRTGKDIPAAAATLGKGLSGSSRLAKELGFSFKDAKDPAKNFDQILAGLQGTVGGYSSKLPEAERNSKALGYGFGDLQESLGEKLMPIMAQATALGLQVVNWISQNVSWLGPLATGLAVVGGAFAILNAVMALNPFVLVVVAIGALVAGLIWCYQNIEGFRNDVNRAFEAIGAVARWLWNNAFAPALRAIVSGFGWVVDGIAGFLEALGSIPGFEWAKGAAANLRGLAQGARAAADGIKNIPDPKVNTGNSRAQIVALDRKIKSLKGKVVEAKAKGDTKEVERLQKKIRDLRGKKVTLEANVKKTGPSKITIRSVGGGVYKIGTSYLQADGGILATLADGRVVQRFADGGFEDHQAQIAPAGRGGAVRVWAEGETGGEAYIPLAASKRARSREIWRETGKRLGMTEMADGGLLLADTSQMLRRRELATASAVVGRASAGGDIYYVTLTAPPGAPRAWAEATERELYGLMKSRGPGGKLIFQKG